ncbi:MAG TPA: SDR family oxidoreductase [Dehalococcoidia bacterium]|nr:SDR family oxidoreductase [Dehalococcoidia bacterium]
MTNPVAVITGASRGIGKQLCIDIAAAGYDIVAVARSGKESPSPTLPGTVDETVALAREAGGPGQRAIATSLDVRDEDGVASLADRVYSEFGRCDALVNNAAISPGGFILSQPTALWRKTLDVNLHGSFYFTYYFAPRMTAGKGHVVNISSSWRPSPGSSRGGYTTSKEALEALTECMAVELAGKVSFNAIRVDIGVYSEGYASTGEREDMSDMEHPVIMSDAVLWFCRKAVNYTGHIHTLREMREMGAIRGPTPVGDVAPGDN